MSIEINAFHAPYISVHRVTGYDEVPHSADQNYRSFQVRHGEGEVLEITFFARPGDPVEVETVNERSHSVRIKVHEQGEEFSVTSEYTFFAAERNETGLALLRSFATTVRRAVAGWS